MIELKHRTVRIILLVAAIGVIISAIVYCVRFDINVTTDNNGTVVCEKKNVHLFQSVLIYIVPLSEEVCYETDRLTVNGKDFTDKIKSGKLRLFCITSDKEISVTFKEKTVSSFSESAAVFV